MKPITLNEVEVDDIRKLARERRQFLGFVGDTPIANDIFTILDKLNILLLEYPIESDNSSPAFSAAILRASSIHLARLPLIRASSFAVSRVQNSISVKR